MSRICVLSLLAFFVGCGSEKSSPSAAIQPAPARAERPDEGSLFTSEGPDAIRIPFQKRVESGEFWKVYIAHKKSISARRPFLNFALSVGHTSTNAGGQATVTATITLAMSEGGSKPFFEDEIIESAVSPGMNSQNLMNEFLKTLTGSKLLTLLSERAALLAQIKEGGELASNAMKQLQEKPDYLTPQLLNAAVTLMPAPGVSVPLLTFAVNRKNAVLRRAAVKELQRVSFKGTEALPVYRELLEFDDATVRTAAIDALIKMGEPAFPDLARALQNRDLDVAHKAARALTEQSVRISATIPILVELTGSAHEPSVRRNALIILCSLNTDAAVMPLAEALTASHAESAWVVEKLIAMGPRGKPAVAKLEHAFNVSDVVLRQNILNILQLIGPENAPFVARALGDIDKNVQATASKLLADLGPQAVPAIAAMMSETRFSVRRNAIMTLGKIGHPAVEHLKAALNDTDKEVRDRATSALQELKIIEVKPKPRNAWETIEPAEKKPLVKTPAPPSPDWKVVTLKNGKTIDALKVVDFGDMYSIKTDDGKIITLPKKDVEKVE